MIDNFQPDALFAHKAQQTEIDTLRMELAEVRKAKGDRIIYLEALALQLQNEAQNEISRLHADLAQLKSAQPQDVTVTDPAPAAEQE